MKKASLLSLFVFFGLFQAVFSQIRTEKQPPPGYYERIKSRSEGKVLDAGQLTAYKPAPLPPHFLDSLKKYDWYELSSYHYVDKSCRRIMDSLNFKENAFANLQLDAWRYQENGVVRQLSLNRLRNGTVEVTTTTFDENSAQKWVAVKTDKTGNWLVTEMYGEQEKQKILGFQNGVMVMEIAQTPGSTTHRFRIAYLAIPKEF